ncbi:MAG: hypothetical protein AB2392_13180 [Neobacillus sp.]
MKKLALVLVVCAILLLSIVTVWTDLSSHLQFGQFTSSKSGDQLKIMMDVTNTSSRRIEGSAWVNLLGVENSKVAKKVYFQFPEGGIKPKETIIFSLEMKDVKHDKWNMGYMRLKDSRTKLIWGITSLLINASLWLYIFFLLNRFITNNKSL